MSKQFDSISESHQKFIAAQSIYFVATAAATGRINLSPKGMDSFRVLEPNKVIWLNLTGSGNETAAHVLDNGRMTVMFCSFAKKPLIMRLYGQASVVHPRDDDWADLIGHFPDQLGARQIFVLDVEMLQTSCGYAVPEMDLVGERDILTTWAEKKGGDGVKDYWREKNTETIDGFETGILPIEKGR